MGEIINKIINNKEFIGIIISFLSIIIPLAIFLISKNKEQKQINFEKFHKVLRALYNKDNEFGLDQQIAIIFEIRNFPEYFTVSKRIIMDSKKYWKLINSEFESPESKKKKLSDEGLKRLTKEADETISYMNKCIIYRFFVRFKDRIKI